MCVCVSVCVSVCLCMCWYAAEVAGTMSRLFLLSGSTRSLFVCVSMCVCVCVCVCVAAVPGQQLLLSG